MSEAKARELLQQTARYFRCFAKAPPESLLARIDAYLAAVPAPAEPTVPFDKVVSALQWALDQIGAPDKSRNEQYRRDYHAANYTLFLANGRCFGIRAEDDDAAPAAEPVAQPAASKLRLPSNETLRRQIENDPDDEPSAGDYECTR